MDRAEQPSSFGDLTLAQRDAGHARQTPADVDAGPRPPPPAKTLAKMCGRRHKVAGLQRDVTQVVGRPADEQVVAHFATGSKGALEQLRPSRRIALAAIDLAEADERDGDHPGARVLRILAELQRLLDEGSRTCVITIHAGEPPQ